MEKIVLRNSDLVVSRLCMGGCPMGRYGWGYVSKSELISTVSKALDMGINFFDSADTYGLGEAEKTLGEALAGKRQRAVIATKFGVRVENGQTFFDNSPKWINSAVENSLRRLRTDYIDLYQIHYRDGKTPFSEVIDSLERLKDKGWIRYYGLSNIHIADVVELKSVPANFISFQDEYSLACRKNEIDVLQLSRLLELTPMTWGSLGQGILTGKYDVNATFSSGDRRSKEIYVNFHGIKFLKNLEIVSELRKISGEINKQISAIAIRWILDYLTGSVVITGIKNTKQLLSNTEALGWNLDKQYIERLRKVSGE